MIDWRGTEIKPGSIIVYPGRQSSSMWMVEAEVMEIITVSPLYSWQPTEALRVQPLRQGGMRVNKKPVTITAIERVTVLPQCKRDNELNEAIEKNWDRLERLI
jgi:hypothetical protein